MSGPVLSAPSAAFSVAGYRLLIAFAGWLLVHKVSVQGGTSLLPMENAEVDVVAIAELYFFLTLLLCESAENI